MIDDGFQIVGHRGLRSQEPAREDVAKIAGYAPIEVHESFDFGHLEFAKWLMSISLNP